MEQVVEGFFSDFQFQFQFQFQFHMQFQLQCNSRGVASERPQRRAPPSPAPVESIARVAPFTAALVVSSLRRGQGYPQVVVVVVGCEKI